MSTGSLRLRLILAASIAISLALGLMGVASYYKFRSRIETLTLNELNGHFEQLASKIIVDETGQISVDGELSDPRFQKQLGGLYWQIETPNTQPLRSRSLWDQVLVVPTPPLAEEEAHVHMLTGPNGTELLSLERTLMIELANGKPVTALVTVGMDQSALAVAARGFGSDIAIGLGLLYLVLMASSLAQIILGLRPLEEIRKGLGAVRNSEAQRMEKSFPSEVQPLVTEINSLLESREHQIQRARHRAGNLAHGLKTPLTILEATASDLQKTGDRKSSTEIRNVIAGMKDIVERELTRARASAENKYARSKAGPAVAKVINALKNLPREQQVSWETRIEPNCTLPVEAGDLIELLGNLMENAHKHARSKIKISASNARVVVEDDGAGVPENLRSEIVKRGVKLDELTAGSGLGLAIVQDLAESYQASLILDQSQFGGLRASFVFNQNAEAS